ncbi:hypothetical protein F5Y12DRAFT_704443 [Xylaria sp. FL1777]|nr:hypothetical protein F5Y12DRAFT_704443 [Xylaria sp. FL1777]
MFLGRIAVASLALLGCATNARYLLNDDSVNTWPEPYYEFHPQELENNAKPSCRRICGSCGSSCSSIAASGQSFLELITSNSTTEGGLSHIDYDDNAGPITKRTFKNVRQSTIGSYLKSKVGALLNPYGNPNTNLISLAYSTATDDYTFAVLRDFSNFGANILNIGIEGLEGCTVLTVVSRRAVYMGHFFENLAFSPDDGQDPDTAFQQNCLNLITGRGQTSGTQGDHLDPSLFTGANGPAIAYIMTPRQDQDDPTPQNPNPPAPGPTTQLYASRMSQLSQTLTTLIPGVGVTYYNYIATNVENYKQDYQGKALFEFDPNADGSNHPNFRLWYEETMKDGRAAGIIK